MSSARICRCAWPNCEQLHEPVAAAAREILGVESPRDGDAGEAPTVADEEAIRHALGRLEATLRARSAVGYDRS